MAAPVYALERYQQYRSADEASAARDMQQQGALAKMQREQQFRNEISMARTPEEQIAVAAKYMGPESLARMQQGSMNLRDAQAARAAEGALARQARTDDMASSIAARGAEQRTTREEADARAVVAARQATLDRQATLGIVAGLKTPKDTQPKPPKDFRWTNDGSEQEVIPGSATDIKMKALKAKDFRNKQTLDSTLDAEIANIDKLIGNEAGVKPHRGLAAMVGPVDSRFPTVLTDTANAEALLSSLQSKASISSLQTIRGTAGSIGSLTEKEWPRLESLKATLQQTQGTKQFTQSLKEYREELRRIKRLGAESLSDTSGAAVVPYGGPDRRAAPANEPRVIDFNSLPR